MQVCFKGCERLHEDVQVWCDRGKCASLYAGRGVWSVSTLICFQIKSRMAAAFHLSYYSALHLLGSLAQTLLYR